jgi:transcriptional regulator with XRE-family HTH domain
MHKRNMNHNPVSVRMTPSETDMRQAEKASTTTRAYPAARRADELDDLKREVYQGAPEAEQAYLDSRQRAQLGAGLKRQRRQAGLTLRQLATEAGWHPSYVSRMESATGPWPKIDSILRYLAACGTNARCGLVIGQPNNNGFEIDSATTISYGRERIFEVMKGWTVSKN